MYEPPDQRFCSPPISRSNHTDDPVTSGTFRSFSPSSLFFPDPVIAVPVVSAPTRCTYRRKGEKGREKKLLQNLIRHFCARIAVRYLSLLSFLLKVDIFLPSPLLQGRGKSTHFHPHTFLTTVDQVYVDWNLSFIFFLGPSCCIFFRSRMMG